MFRPYPTLHTVHVAAKCCFGCAMLSVYFLDITDMFSSCIYNQYILQIIKPTTGSTANATKDRWINKGKGRVSKTEREYWKRVLII